MIHPKSLAALFGGLFLATGLPAQVASQTYEVAQSAWEDPAGSLPHPRLAQIGVPRNAGSLSLTELTDFNNSGGVDNIAQYRSADGQTFGTIYIYQTTLTDPAMAALATDHVIRSAYGDQTAPSNREFVQAGEHEDMALMIVYDGAFDGMRSSAAAFMGAGVWTIKVRVTGPQTDRDGIVADIRLLLSGMTFGEDATPFAPRALSVSQCPVTEFGEAAQLLNEPPSEGGISSSSVGALIVAGGLISNRHETLESMANSGFSLAGNDFCMMGSRQIRRGTHILVLSHTGPEIVPAIVLVGDAGLGLEIIPDLTSDGNEADSNIVNIMLHRLGRAEIYGPFDRTPTLDQFYSLLTEGMEWLGQSRGSVTISPSGDTHINIVTEEE